MRLISNRDEQSLRDLQGYATYCRSVAAKEHGEETERGALRECVRRLVEAAHHTTQPILADTRAHGYETTVELTVPFDVVVQGEEVRYCLHGVEVTDLLYALNGAQIDPDLLQQLNMAADELVEEAEWHNPREEPTEEEIYGRGNA